MRAFESNAKTEQYGRAIVLPVAGSGPTGPSFFPCPTKCMATASPPSMNREYSRTGNHVIRYSRENAAERAGVEPDYLVRLVKLGILAPDESDRFSPGDVRRVLMARSIEDAGIPLDEVGGAIRRGALS